VAPGREAEDASPLVPERLSLRALRAAAADCEACPLHERATRTVFGAGRRNPRLILIGEQPGDREDRAGQPFVGPAGRLLDELLEEAGIVRSDAYVTNAVKHFKWKEGRGKRRIHDKPSRSEIKACLPWLGAELELIRPEVAVLLGATAAGAVLGPKVRVTRDRGHFFEPDEAGLGERGPLLTLTLHPSAILRQRERADREREKAGVVEDLRAAAARLG
jgi:uracil-DNA glycosylase